MKSLTSCILIIAFLMIWGTVSHAQSSWQHSFGGSDVDVATAVQPTSDGGYVFAGWTRSADSEIAKNNGSADVWVVKTDLNGAVQWSKTFGGSNEDEAYDIQLTSDGGYIVVGYSYSSDGDITSGNHGYQDVLVMKLTSTGSLSWEKTYGGSDNDIGYSIQQTGDGGYIIGGTTYSNNGDVGKNQGLGDMWLLKIDDKGTKSWANTFGGSGTDVAYAVRQTNDGGYVLAGATKSPNGDVTGFHNSGFGSDYWVVKTDGSGALSWEKTLGGALDEEAHAIWQSSDESYVINGYSYSTDGDISGNHGVQDMWVVNLSQDGTTVQWQTALGGSQPDMGYSIKQNTDGTYIAGGVTQSGDGEVSNYHGANDYWIARLNITGKLLSEYAFGGSSDDIAHCVAQTMDGGFIIAGETNSTDDDVTKSFGSTDAWLVKITANLSVSPLSKQEKNILVYPTVTNNVFNISLPQGYEHATLRLVNRLGENIVIPETYGLTRQVAMQPTTAGMYLLQVVNGHDINNFRIIYKP